MEIHNFMGNLKEFQSLLLQYLNEKNNLEENYEYLINKLFESKFCSNPNDLRLFLRLISKIANNHYQTPNFFSKIEKILLVLKDQIKQTLSNFQLFKIFKNSKMILLFLIKEKMLLIDKSIVDIFTNYKYKYLRYPEFFFPEIKEFLDETKIEKITKKIPENFEEKRKIGQNDEYICELIRNDSIKEFVELINKSDYTINSNVKESIFETNNFLLKKSFSISRVSLIEYAAFFGSINIFKYLYTNKAKVNPELLIYSIHSNNEELIHISENIKFEKKKKRRFGYDSDYDFDELYPFYNDYLDNEEEPKDNTREKCLMESIKCHHNNIIDYIMKYWLLQIDSTQLISQFFKSCNFVMITNDFNYNVAFYNCCKYEYITLAALLLKLSNIDVNYQTIIDDEISNRFLNGVLIYFSHYTPLYAVIKNENIELLKLLLSCQDLNVNILNILIKLI